MIKTEQLTNIINYNLHEIHFDKLKIILTLIMKLIKNSEIKTLLQLSVSDQKCHEYF